MLHKSDIKKKSEQWFKYANEDLRLAEYALKMTSSCPYRLIAYHSPQAVEKYLKSVLVKELIDFSYTHNILRLLELCENVDGFDIQKISEAEELTPYAITTRYPGEDEKVSKSEAIRAIELAKKVKKYIYSLLK